MYKIEGNNVFYKNDSMNQFIHYGLLYAMFATEENNTYEVRKFDEKEQSYLPATDISKWEMNGIEYELNESRFVCLPEPQAQAATYQFQFSEAETLIINALTEINEKLSELGDKINTKG